MVFGVTARRSVHNHAIHPYCRASRFYLVRDKMLRWYLTVTSLSARYRVNLNWNIINSLQTSCFLIFNFIIAITGGGGSDFLSSRILTSSEQFSSFFNFFRMRVSGSRHIYSLLVESLGLLYYY